MSLLITLKDKFGFQRLVGSEPEMEQLEVSIVNPRGKSVEIHVTNNNNGTYTAKFDGRLAGVCGACRASIMQSARRPPPPPPPSSLPAQVQPFTMPCNAPQSASTPLHSWGSSIVPAVG